MRDQANKSETCHPSIVGQSSVRYERKKRQISGVMSEWRSAPKKKGMQTILRAYYFGNHSEELDQHQILPGYRK